MAREWIFASKSPVVPGTEVHAFALTPVAMWFIWWSWWNFCLVLVVAGVMGYLQWKGRKPAWVLRRSKAKLRGEVVAARPVWYRRRRGQIESYETLDIQACDRIEPDMKAPAKKPSQTPSTSTPRQAGAANSGRTREQGKTNP